MRAPPRLVVITDTTVASADVLPARVERVLEGAMPGTVAVQLRDLDLSSRERLSLGERLVERCRAWGQLFVVNDRLDVATLLGADGIHLGEASVATADARRLLPDVWVSRACHDALGVAELDADAVVLSPAAAVRKGRAPIGTGAFRRARALLDAKGSARAVTLYALGGVDASNAAEFLAAGAGGVAVVGAVLDGRDPGPLLDALEIRRAQ